MDMNFPHKHREGSPDNEAAAGSSQSADHRFLLARAIARQASSESARYFGAARLHNEITREAVRSSFMDERMAFFAGRLGPDLVGRSRSKMFRPGCFRPDLAQRGLNKMHS